MSAWRNTTVPMTSDGAYPDDKIEVSIDGDGTGDVWVYAQTGAGPSRKVHRVVLVMTNAERKALRKALRKPKGK